MVNTGENWVLEGGSGTADNLFRGATFGLIRSACPTPGTGPGPGAQTMVSAGSSSSELEPSLPALWAAFDGSTFVTTTAGDVLASCYLLGLENPQADRKTYEVIDGKRPLVITVSFVLTDAQMIAVRIWLIGESQEISTCFVMELPALAENGVQPRLNPLSSSSSRGRVLSGDAPLLVGCLRRRLPGLAHCLTKESL